MEALISGCLYGAPFLPAPLIGSRDSHLVTREYFPVFHIVHPAFALLGDLIFLRYCIMLCLCTCVIIAGMYITTVLPYSDSFLYCFLAYIREGISDLRIYVAVTSPYLPNRGVTGWYC